MHSDDLRDLRLNRNESQTEFWGRFGVNQRTASRIERGQPVPPAIAILVRLYLDGVIGDADLERAQRRFKIALQAMPSRAATTAARVSAP
jgi:transcriptional regulator with XRE-family HTH domain